MGLRHRVSESFSYLALWSVFLAIKVSQQSTADLCQREDITVSQGYRMRILSENSENSVQKKLNLDPSIDPPAHISSL